MEGVHGQGSAHDDRLHRGRSVALAFLMQASLTLNNSLQFHVLMAQFKDEVKWSIKWV